MARTITPPPCAARTCALPGQHGPDCGDPDECTGCLPALAADGLRLCPYHHRRLRADLLLLAIRFADLGRVLVPVAGTTERTSGGSENTGLSLNEEAVELRARIRATLTSLAGEMAAARSFTGPARVPEQAVALARGADWLAARPAAGEWAVHIGDLAHGRAHEIAAGEYDRIVPLRRDGVDVACLAQIDGGECPGALRAVLRRPDSLMPAKLVCSIDEEHELPASAWLPHLQALRTA